MPIEASPLPFLKASLWAEECGVLISSGLWSWTISWQGSWSYSRNWKPLLLGMVRYTCRGWRWSEVTYLERNQASNGQPAIFFPTSRTMPYLPGSSSVCFAAFSWIVAVPEHVLDKLPRCLGSSGEPLHMSFWVRDIWFHILALLHTEWASHTLQVLVFSMGKKQEKYRSQKCVLRIKLKEEFITMPVVRNNTWVLFPWNVLEIPPC